MTAKQIEQKVIAYCKEKSLVRQGDRILLGLSGGGDSVCLFYMLLALQKEVDFSLRAVHIHHGIRKEAEEDVVFVEKLCKENHIPCRIYRENVPAYAGENGLSEEEAGRILRYQDFRKEIEKWKKEENLRQEKQKDGVLQKGNDTLIDNKEEIGYFIATAHHMDDQAETILFQLARGSGFTGLGGIRAKREDLIRPLLCLSKEEIQDYLTLTETAFQTDQTNAMDEYARNKIRHHILPYLEEEICEGSTRHIAKCAEIMQEANSYILQQVEKAFLETSSLLEKELQIDRIALQQKDIFIQKEVCRYGLSKLVGTKKDITAAHIDDILRLAEKNGNGQIYLPYGVIVRKSYDKLVFSVGETKQLMQKPVLQTEIIEVSDVERIRTLFGAENMQQAKAQIPEKPYTKWFDYDKINEDFCLRHRCTGDYITVNEKMGRKTIKEYMIGEKIPQKERDAIWLLADGKHILWVIGHRISSYYKVTESTKRILQVTVIETTS